MPMERRLQVLEARIEERFGVQVVCIESTYDELNPSFVGHLLKELGDRGEDFPVVLLGEEIACAGGIHIEAILALIEASRAAGV